MSWTQQVWHVFRKDVREQRWVLGLYGLLVLMGLLEGMDLLAATALKNGYVIAMTVLLRAVAAYLSAAIILEDSPTGPRAFWTSLPFERSAMFAAKSLMLAMILLGTVAALAVPLLRLSVSGTQLGLQLLNFGVSYATLLVATALFAGLVSHMRTVLLAYVTAVAILWLVVVVLPAPSAASQLATSSWLLVAALVTALIALALVYRTRHTSRTRTGVVMVACALLLLSPLTVRGFGPVVPQIATERVTGWTASLQLTSPDSTQAMYGAFRTFRMLNIATTGSPRWDNTAPTTRVELITSSASISTDHGRDKQLAVSLTHRLIDPPMPLAPNVRWLRSVSRSTTVPGTQPAQSLSNAVGLNASGVTGIRKVHANGRLEFREARRIAAVSAVRDTSFSVDGWRFTVQPTSASDRPFIRVHTLSTTITRDGVPRHAIPLDNVSFALVNAQRGEAIPLYKSGFASASSWSLSPGSVAEADGLLSTSPVQVPIEMQQNVSSVARDLPTPEWMRDARLVIYEWVLTATSPVSISSDVQRAAIGPE